MLKNNTRIGIPRKIIGGQYHKILDDSLISDWSSSEGTPLQEISWKPVPKLRQRTD